MDQANYNILLLESIADSAYQSLDANVTIIESDDPYTGGVKADKTAIHGIICRGKGDVNKDLMDRCPNLRVIARCGVGVDNIDVAYANKKGIKVINTPGLNADSVAEQTMALMLILQRQLYPIIADVKAHNWNNRNNYQGDEIRAKTLGIVGMGNIGQKVAGLATAFGMKVQYYNRRALSLVYPSVSLEQLMKTSDIISLHLPLTDDTRALVDDKLLSLMKPSALLINTGRGAVIQESALVAALSSGRLGGFAADVMAVQPPADDHPLLTMDNVILTPHISSLTKLTYDEMCNLAVANTLAILNGEVVDEQYVVV